MYPVLWLGNDFYLPSYFTVIALAYCLAIIYLYFRTLKYQQSLLVAMDLAIIIMIGGFLGARLFHVIYEAPGYYFENPLDIFKVWQGGFVFYGGAFFAITLSLFYLKRKSQDILTWLDIFAPIVPVTYFWGRFATLLSGSGYGKATTLPWGIVYPPGTEAPSGVALHPTPIYAMIFEASAFLIIYFSERGNFFKVRKKKGDLFFLMIICHGFGRLIV
ncbi:MAG: prolipoprotein diacylglyceryl transferase, partial [Bdellovibrionales bacterium]|nr:prolipoprotein diacylglyceryl transferase [Bdellovibrionales bacterium]